jgi:GNAT superfamily N-acetyltransferase
MRVIDYEPSRAREIVELWRASFEYGVGIKDPYPIESQLEFFLREVAPHCRVRLSVEGAELLGFMASTPSTLDHLYVRVSNLSQGIGSCLLELAKSESSGSLSLHAFAQNHRACRFYEHHGFKEVERESKNMYKIEAIKYVWLKAESAA